MLFRCIRQQLNCLVLRWNRPWGNSIVERTRYMWMSCEMLSNHHDHATPNLDVVKGGVQAAFLMLNGLVSIGLICLAFRYTWYYLHKQWNRLIVKHHIECYSHRSRFTEWKNKSEISHKCSYDSFDWLWTEIQKNWYFAVSSFIACAIKIHIISHWQKYPSLICPHDFVLFVVLFLHIFPERFFFILN